MRLAALALSAFIAASATGCAATRGTVVMKTDSTHAHVRLGKNDVAVADTVRLYRRSCFVTSQRREICSHHTIAEGTVTEILGDDYSVVQFPAGTHIAEGYQVEKLR